MEAPHTTYHVCSHFHSSALRTENLLLRLHLAFPANLVRGSAYICRAHITPFSSLLYVIRSTYEGKSSTPSEGNEKKKKKRRGKRVESLSILSFISLLPPPSSLPHSQHTFPSPPPRCIADLRQGRKRPVRDLKESVVTASLLPSRVGKDIECRVESSCVLWC